MSGSAPQKLGILARLVVGCIMVFIFAGIFWHGITEATLERFWHDLIARPDAPTRFRFVLQPLMAAAVAILDGLKDARAGRAPYFWTMLRTPQKRIARLNEGLNATARIILIGLLMDIIYQLLVLKEFYPNESVVIAVLLAFLPYVILRGPVRRIAGRRLDGASPRQVS
ncbi:MAG: hypothetical protein ACREFO_04685 [Acetobacteraceae bacterium]